MDRREAWAEARRLVVVEEYDYAAAARATGLCLSTVEKRAGREEWRRQRKTATRYADQVRMLKAGLLEKAAEKLRAGEDATQLVFAWKSAESAYPEHRYQPEAVDPKARLVAALAVLDELVSYLSEEAPDLLTRLRPHIAPFSSRLEQAII